MKHEYKVTILLIIITNLCFSQPKENFYYYNSFKKKVVINKKRLVVYINDNNGTTTGIEKRYKIGRKVGGNESIIKNSSCKRGLEIILDDSTKYEEIVHELKKDDMIIDIEQVIGIKSPVLMSNLFYVKIKEEKDTSILKEMSNKTKTTIIRQVEYSKKWYVLEANKFSISNTLDISNLFAESGFFEKIDPGFILNIRDNIIPSDTRFAEQWSILNSNGIDIKATQAWNIKTGSISIKTAIFDTGIDNSHQELSNMPTGLNYDAHTQSSAQVYNEHGTSICGIVSANHNLHEIAGVTPLTKIIEISHPFYPMNNYSEELSRGLNWAVQNNVDVINNSWGDQGGEQFNDVHSVLLEEALDNAIINGRGGKGCIVVFAAGNNYGVMDYPGKYRSEILTVGSINSSGLLSDFSGYGTELDVVAPGEDILTISPGNLYVYQSGTSLSAPHASAIASLILSINPSLTGKQVVDIIERTAQKIGGYNYSTSTLRSNGTWNNQIGYGLVDAYSAVLTEYVCPTTNLINQTVTYNKTLTGCKVWIQNTTVSPSKKLTINYDTEVIINNSFEIPVGAELEIY